tara:strand:+ start:5239 stop:5679 length:441 start_codon:yes stop_codon:yes gene_type:complete
MKEERSVSLLLFPLKGIDGLATWRKKIVYVKCNNCENLCESKNRFNALCKDCIKEYLNNLEDMADKALKTSKVRKEKKKEYDSIYSKIIRQRESLVGIPRFLKIETFERDCLKCNKWFMAQGRFNRLCEYCKENHSEINDLWERPQ